MTENEAISFLKERQEVSKDYPEVAEYYDALSVAIKALEEIQQYRAIGTVEECRAAVEIHKALYERKLTPEDMEEYMKFEDECVKKGFTFKSMLDLKHGTGGE